VLSVDQVLVVYLL